MRAEAHLHIGRARKGLVDCISNRLLPNGKVQYHGVVSFTNARFVVQPAGFRRYKQTKQKNVHAFVRGDLYGCNNNIDEPALEHDTLLALGYREAYYNPQTAVEPQFTDKNTGLPLTGTYDIILVGKRVFYRA